MQLELYAFFNYMLHLITTQETISSSARQRVPFLGFLDLLLHCYLLRQSFLALPLEYSVRTSTLNLSESPARLLAA